MLEKIGARQQSLAAELKLNTDVDEKSYLRRDWSRLRTFLELLHDLGPHMTPENAVSAVQLLLRMSLDPIVTDLIPIRAAHASAMRSLVGGLASVGHG